MCISHDNFNLQILYFFDHLFLETEERKRDKMFSWIFSNRVMNINIRFVPVILTVREIPNWKYLQVSVRCKRFLVKGKEVTRCNALETYEKSTHLIFKISNVVFHVTDFAIQLIRNFHLKTIAENLLTHYWTILV